MGKTARRDAALDLRSGKVAAPNPRPHRRPPGAPRRPDPRLRERAAFASFPKAPLPRCLAAKGLVRATKAGTQKSGAAAGVCGWPRGARPDVNKPPGPR